MKNIFMSNSQSDSDGVDEPEAVDGSGNLTDSSSEDDKVEETRSKTGQTILKNQSELLSKNGDISDSETDIDKPPKSTGRYSIKKSLPITQNLSRKNSATQEEDSGEESEEQLSMSLLQGSAQKQKSSSKKEMASSSTRVLNTSSMSEVGGKFVRVERKAPEMSASESDSSDEDTPAVVKREQTSQKSPEVLEASISERISPFVSQTPQMQAAWNAQNLEELYTRLSSPPLHIPEDSSVWILQIPYDIPASHLVGQHFPTKLKGGEMIEGPSFSLHFREQPCVPSNKSLYCIKSVGDFSYDMQLIHPRGFWTLRQPSFSMEPQKKDLGWGVPVAPISVEELLKMKSNTTKKHLSPQKHRASLNSEDINHGKGRKSEDMSPNQKKKKKKHHHDHSSGAEDTSVIDYDDASISPKKKKKKKKTSFDESDIVENSSCAESGTIQGKKRKRSTSLAEEGSSPHKKKKHRIEDEQVSVNFCELNQPHHLNQMESIKQIEQNLEEKQIKKPKKRKHKNADSFEETSSFVTSVKIEENAMENYQNLLEESCSPKKKKKKKEISGENSDLSVSLKVELSDDGQDVGNVLKNVKKKKHKKKLHNIEDDL